MTDLFSGFAGKPIDPSNPPIPYVVDQNGDIDRNAIEVTPDGARCLRYTGIRDPWGKWETEVRRGRFKIRYRNRFD